MKQKIILTIAILSLLSLAVFASALGGVMTGGNDSPYDVQINIVKGWNIIAGVLPNEAIASDSQIKSTNLKAVWYYAPNLRKYVQIHPDLDMSAQIDDDIALTSAMWVYSDKAGILKYNTLEDYMPLSMRELSTGYNFVTITPDMVNSNTASQGGGNLKVQDIIKNCNVEKSYLFDTDSQQWVSFPIDEEFYSDFVGLGWVVKVSNSCNLGSSGVVSPPTIPETSTPSSSCVDTDGGEDYYTKGTVTASENGVTFSAEDECGILYDDVQGSSNILNEKYCTGTGAKEKSYTCPNGCSDGACIQ